MKKSFELSELEKESGKQMAQRIISFCLAFTISLTVYAETGSSTQLKKIQDEHWQHQLEESIYYRIKFGLPVTKLPDVSYSGAKAESAFAQSILKKLEQVDPKELDHEEWLSLEIMKWECSIAIEYTPYFYLNPPVTPYGSSLSVLRLAFSSHPLDTKENLSNYEALLKKVPEYTQKILLVIQEQEKKGIRIPREELKLVVPFVTSFAIVGEQSPFFVNLEHIKEAGAEDFQKRVNTIIENEISPAFKKLIAHLTGDYEKSAPEQVGLGQYPDGKAYYRLLVRYHTTMDVTPEQVHEIGQERVRKLQERMQALREALGFTGTREEFHRMLKQDPKCFPKTAEEIGEKLLFYDRKIQPRLEGFFLKKAAAPYTVKRLDPRLEGSMTFGYYQEPTKADPTGTYYYNGSNLSERPLFDSASLVYHELIPGHHYQISRQSENQSLPPFRRDGGHTAYIEGWAEYASGLAEEMGMYEGEDPYDLYGRLAAEMFLTVRLVVDTGMNYLGWPRSQAVQFMRENLLVSDTQIHTESLRYSCDIPGQALGYRMGSDHFRQLREKAKLALGGRFDIREFHDAVLQPGSMPMTVLEKHLEWFIKGKQ